MIPRGAPTVQPTQPPTLAPTKAKKLLISRVNHRSSRVSNRHALRISPADVRAKVDATRHATAAWLHHFADDLGVTLSSSVTEWALADHADDRDESADDHRDEEPVEHLSADDLNAL
jgi:hypothetical protein